VKILLHSLIIAAAAASGLAVGFALRVQRGSEPAASPAVTSASPGPAVPQAKPARGLNRRARVRPKDDSPLATQLERDLSMSSGVTRWLYWMEALEKAAPGDLPRLARLAQGDSTATRFVAARWVEVAPRHLFDTMMADMKSGRGLPDNELTTALFDEWPKRDPDAAIAALNETNVFGARWYWRARVAGALIEKDAERGLRLMSEWHIDSFGPRMTGVVKWAAANPRHAAEFTLEHPAGYASQLTMETIGKQWAKTDPAGALEFAASKPGEPGSALATSALKEWAGRDLNAAADWLASAEARTRHRLSAAFVEIWARQDANSALNWCEENLTGSALAQAVGGVVKGAAEKDVAAASALVAAMNPSPARAEAAAAVAQKWFPDLLSNETVKPEAIAWLAGLDGESVRRALDQIQWSWSTADPQSMAAFLNATDTEQLPLHTFTILARQFARTNPQDALEWASRLSADRALSAGGEAFAEWRSSQPEAAMKWLNDLPSDDARRQSYFESTIRSLAYHPQVAEQLAVMSVAERAVARGVIESMCLPEDRRARLLDLLKPR
jgi:hypothetical protein